MKADKPTPQDDLYLAAGSLLMTSSGEYSDESLYRSKMSELRDKVIRDDARDEAKAEANGTWHDSDKRELFIAAMIRKGWLMAVTYTELHLGSYGDLELGL